MTDPDSDLRQEALRELARRELARRQQMTSNERQPSSRFDTPLARQLFPASGQLIGGLSAGALATPGSLGTATVPAAVAGGIGGGIAGESLRQVLASMTGGGPRSYGQQAQELVKAGGTAAITEAIPPVLGAVARPVGGVAKAAGRFLYKNIPDPVLNWVKTRAEQGVDILNFSMEGARDNVLSAVKRLGDALKVIQREPERLQPPSPKTLYPVAEKVANALDTVRRQVGTQYGEAAQHALETPARASLAQAGKVLTSELRQAGLINARNVPVAFGAREFTSEERLLLNVFEDLRGMVQPPTEGLPEAMVPGTFINYDKALRMLGRIDEAMGGAKLRNTQRILGTARHHIVEGLKRSDDQLAKQIPAYGRFVGIRDAVEMAAESPDKTVSLLLSSLKETKAGLRGQLEQLDTLAPSEFKFMDDLTQYQARTQAAEVARQAPKTVTSLLAKMKTPQQMEGLIRSIFNQPKTTLAELEALELVSDTKFLDEFRDMAARAQFNTYRPSGLGIPRIQAEMLRWTLPVTIGAERIGQSAGRVIPALPPGISALIPREERNR